MDREEAGRALELLKRVVGQARDDAAMQNWGVIWMVHAVANGAGFVATDLLIRRGVLRPWPHALMWSGIIVLDLLCVLFLKAKKAGTRSFVEDQIWSIWTTFIAAVALLAVLNHLMGLKTFYLGPVIGVLSAMGFSMMGSLIGKRWYAGTIVFTAAALAMAQWPRWQFTILGIVWGVGQFGAGVWLLLEKRRAQAAGGRAGLV